jgi:carotenoid cleavage dioxygenase-like enzyme
MSEPSPAFREPRPRASESNPFLRGNHAPWRAEGDASDLEIVGALPRELVGTYFRNGPNPAFEPKGRYHWFDGDGMIHAITCRDGRATYRNRYVQSAGLVEERAAGRAIFDGLLGMRVDQSPRFKNAANTNIVWHAGKLLALVESSLPTQLVPGSLATVGEYDFNGRLQGPMTAHPKVDPTTGELHFFGYSPFPPYLTYYRADRDGAIVQTEAIEVAWPSMIHDFHITEHSVVFILCPVVFSFENAASGKGLFRWEPERGTRIGLMPRGGTSSQTRWYDTAAGYVFHPLNAYEDGERVVIDVCRSARLDFMAPKTEQDARYRDDNAARLHRWEVDRATGRVSATCIDDLPVEFPRIDERRLGRRHRYGYVAAVDPDAHAQGQSPVWGAVRCEDFERGSSVLRRFAPGAGVGEPLFVPRGPTAAENDGWVLVLAFDPERQASDFYVLAADDLAGEPVAVVRLPHRVPYGFHGNWIPAV